MHLRVMHNLAQWSHHRVGLLVLVGMLVYLTGSRKAPDEGPQGMTLPGPHAAEATAVAQVRRSLKALPSMAEGPTKFKQCRGPQNSRDVPHLRSVRQWRSSKARQEESITLVTQLSLERLEMLENQCSVWPDPIAAVVYVPTVRGRIMAGEDPSNGRPLEEAVARLETFHEHMHLQGSCVLDLELATEDFYEEGEAGLYYPFNAARNRALMLAQTEVLLLLDADFIPSTNALAAWKTPEGYARLVQQLSQPQAVVLPAFETESSGFEGRALAFAAARGGKGFAVNEYKRGSLFAFATKVYSKGHSPTNYTLWAAHDRPYTIKYEQGYEPYVLVSRRYVPWYDERFRGYGWDKIQHLMHLAGLNIKFIVHPTAFVVHVPHKLAATKLATKFSGQHDALLRLFLDVKKAISRRRFAPVVSFPQLCASQ